MEDPIITINDIRKTGHCVSGIKSWFALHDLDFRSFVQSGVSASVLLATGDGLAHDVVSKVQDRNANG